MNEPGEQRRGRADILQQPAKHAKLYSDPFLGITNKNSFVVVVVVVVVVLGGTVFR